MMLERTLLLQVNFQLFLLRCGCQKGV